MSVKVTSFGAEVQDLQWKEGLTANDYLGEAKVTLARDSTLSINGEQAAPTTTVEDGDVLVVAPKIANG